MKQRLNSGIAPMLLVTVCLLMVWAWTKPNYQGDAIFYGQSVLRFESNPADAKAYFEAGHLLWRPLGHALWIGLRPVLAGVLPGEPLLQVLAALQAVSLLSTWLCAVFLTALLLRCCKGTTAVLLVGCWILWNPVVNYGPSGSSYMTSLCALAACVWGIVKAVEARAQGGSGFVWSWISGVALAIASLFWFPAILVAPAAALMAMVWRKDATLEWRGQLRQRIPLAGHLTLSCVLAVTLASLWAMEGMGFRTVAEFTAWFSASSHDKAPQRSLLPLLTGLPRAFLDLGSEALLFKRVLLRDPYAPVNWPKLILLGVGKLLIPLLFLMASAVLVWVSRNSQRLGMVLAAGMIPMLVFAVLLFDATSPERFLPMTPFFLMALACVLGPAWRSDRFWERGLAGFCVTVLVLISVHNLYECSRWRVNLRDSEAATRVASFSGRASSESAVIFLLFSRDRLAHLALNDPFHPLNRRPGLPLREVFAGWGLPGKRDWQAGFAAQVDEHWSQCKEVWISRRLLAARPDPGWMWVEGENRAIPWASIPKFFNQWEIAESAGGADGFARLAPSEGNRSVIAGVLGKPAATCLRNGL